MCEAKNRECKLNNKLIVKIVANKIYYWSATLSWIEIFVFHTGSQSCSFTEGEI